MVPSHRFVVAHTTSRFSSVRVVEEHFQILASSFLFVVYLLLAFAFDERFVVGHVTFFVSHPQKSTCLFFDALLIKKNTRGKIIIIDTYYYSSPLSRRPSPLKEGPVFLDDRLLLRVSCNVITAASPSFPVARLWSFFLPRCNVGACRRALGYQLPGTV